MSAEVETCRRKTFWGWFLVSWAVVDLVLGFILLLVAELKLGPIQTSLADLVLNNTAMTVHVGMLLAGMILLNTRPQGVRDDFVGQARLREAREDCCTSGVLAGVVCLLLFSGTVLWLVWRAAQ
jgi:hypothetical protein